MGRKSHVSRHVDVMSFPKTPALVTDCAVFDMNDRVLLVRRGSEPFKGRYALPGGFVDVGETVEAACAREVEEETGVSISDQRLLLVGVYSKPDRDPRGHTVSIAYTTRIDVSAEPKPGSDAESAEWIRDWSSLSLAFNHTEIIADAESLIQSHWA
jgi:8-oxo-dGTP diphosphatase